VGRLLYRIGELAARRRWPVLAVWAAVAVALALLVGRYGSNTSDDLRLPGADSQAASDLLASRFPPQQNGSSPIVFHVPTGKVTDAATKQAIEASRSAILQLPHVYSATDPFGQKGQSHGPSHTTAVVRSDGLANLGVMLEVGDQEVMLCLLDTRPRQRDGRTRRAARCT
jgi:RND superfamily putative drug exporter